MAGRKSDEELLLITKMYDFILWSCNHTSKFPRNHRFVLGERIERNLYDLLESLIEAKYSRARTPLLQKANLRLEILRRPVSGGGSSHWRIAVRPNEKPIRRVW